MNLLEAAFKDILELNGKIIFPKNKVVVIYINESFPTYSKAEKENARGYHIMRCSIEALLNYLLENEEIPREKFEEKRGEILAQWGEM